MPKSMQFATEWRVSDNRGRPRLVCVHGYTAILLKLSMVEGAYRERTHTHTHTHTLSACKRMCITDLLLF